MQPVREIPGYLYDKEKNRYFRIQHANSANSIHSSHDAKRIKLDKERKEANQAALKRQHGRIKRSVILQDPSMGGLLSRSSGRTSLDASHIFAAGLTWEGRLRQTNYAPLNNHAIFAIDPRSDQVERADVWTVTNTLSRLPIRLDMDKSIKTKAENDRIAILNRNRDLNLGNEYATSICLDGSIGQVAVTSLRENSFDGAVRICYLSRSADDTEQGLPIAEEQISNARQEISDEGDFWSSAAAPSSSSLRFAFGTSNGLLTLAKGSSKLEIVKQAGRTRKDANFKDIWAVDFLDPNVLLSGSRKGVLNLVDLRNPRFANIIRHGSSITHIRHLDEHRILVAGLKTSQWPMCQYDIRFIKQDTFGPNLHPSSSPRGKAQTRPIITYPDYHNPADWNVGLDIDLETGVIAAAQPYHETDHNPVQLFSLKGGHKLRCEALEMCPIRRSLIRNDPSSQRNRPFRCVRFVEDMKGRAKSLWVGADTGLTRYTWANDRDDSGVVQRT